jgi:hypothetical protein
MVRSELDDFRLIKIDATGSVNGEIRVNLETPRQDARSCQTRGAQPEINT